MSRGTLVGGIGNIFLGDDGFGVEVVRRLAQRPPRPDVHIADFGIRSLDLAYALADGFEDVILVDAMPRGKPVGTLTVIEPSRNELVNAEPMSGLAAHGFGPAQVLEMAVAFGGQRAGRIRIVGCEPGEFPPESDVYIGLSAPVAAAVERAVELVEELVQERARRA
ncbi:MAG: hydrogenase maturation protease [Gemmatimonadales bacterium]